jgi:hypothetical protein
MSWTLNVSRVDDEGEFLKVFGQIVFAGVYVAGGDGVGVFNFNGVNTAGLPVFLSGQTQLHATRGPFEYSVNLEGGFNAVVIPGTTPTNTKIKIWNTTTGAELSAGAYPAGITGQVFHSCSFAFKKNL